MDDRSESRTSGWRLRAAGLAACLGGSLLALTGCPSDPPAPYTGPSGPRPGTNWLDEGPDDGPVFIDGDGIAGPEDLEPAMDDDPVLSGDEVVPDDVPLTGMSLEEARQIAAAVARDPLGGCTIYPDLKRVVIRGVTLFQRGPFLELLACTDRGKTHESLIMAFVSPEKLHLALLSLGLEPVAEVEFFGEQKALEKAPRLAITLEWEDEDGNEVRRLAEDVLRNQYTRGTMQRVGFAFGGSRFVTIPAGYEGPEEKQIYAGLYMGAVATVYHDPDSVLDNPLLSGGDDQTYLPNEDVLPPRYTEVRLVFEPWQAELHGDGADPQARGTLGGDGAARRALVPWTSPVATGGPIGAARSARLASEASAPEGAGDGAPATPPGSGDAEDGESDGQ